MGNASPARPTAAEHTPYFGRYIALVPDGDLLAALSTQGEATARLLAALPAARARRRPAPGEWCATEIVGHLADVERVFVYRALRIMRGDLMPLNGVADFEGYVATAGFARREPAIIAAEFTATRAATVALFRDTDDTAWARVGSVDGDPISVRALAYLIAGHELHHLSDLRHLTAAP
jgi:hypothetical protein